MNKEQLLRLLLTVDDTELGENDFENVYEEVQSLAAEWRSMCTALRLLPSLANAIAKAYHHDPWDCLRDVLRRWLNKEHNTEYGVPTWRMLVETVAKQSGGSNPALAEKIAKNHPKKHTISGQFTVPADGNPSHHMIPPHGGALHVQSQYPPQHPQAQPYPLWPSQVQPHPSLQAQWQGQQPLATPSQAAYQMSYTPSTYAQPPPQHSATRDLNAAGSHFPQGFQGTGAVTVTPPLPVPFGTYTYHQPETTADQQNTMPAGQSLQPQLQPDHRQTFSGGAADNGRPVGTNSVWYRKVFSKLDVIVGFLATNVSPGTLADKLWVAHLINEDIRDKASVMGVTNREKIRPMITAVLAQIGMNDENYTTFIRILRGLGAMDDLISQIESV